MNVKSYSRLHAPSALIARLRIHVPCIINLICMVTLLSALAQPQDQSVSYAYDENGRLRAVISPAGEAAIYEYDPVGNLTAIRRLEANELEFISLSPQAGTPGDLVTFNGVGFSAGVIAVTFNGVMARIIQVTAASLIVEVPAGATTGAVTITTPVGALRTPPFTIVPRVQISPALANLLPGDAVQFKAQITPALDDQRLRWSVNGVEGGNATVGTISPTGMYEAPRQLPSSAVINIQATYLAAPALSGGAEVALVNHESVPLLFSPALSIRYDQKPTQVLALNTGLSIQRGSAGISDPRSVSVSVSIQRGSALGRSEPTAAPVAIRLGDAVGIGGPSNSSVSVATGPHIAAIVPAQVPRGVTVTLTLTGKNLAGASDLRFITTTGVWDSTIAVLTITANADGTSLTATINVDPNASPGQRVVIVSTPAGSSLEVDGTLNALTVSI
jgi:YD repeat-containing protein